MNEIHYGGARDKQHGQVSIQPGFHQPLNPIQPTETNIQEQPGFKHALSSSFQVTNQNLGGSFYIRLKEKFKLFISGPSRCGKTVFISKLIEYISSFAKKPPSTIIYVYKVWQQKYDEMMSLGINFILDSDTVVDDIKSGASGQPVFVIFDDLINSPSL